MSRRERKAQSAMEYLMTYGWAILIIAVVLGALFQLGVFNAGTFAPKAPPGACQVFRPNGPTSISNINLEGVCNGELPQYVGVFRTGQVGMTIPHTDALAVTGEIAVSFWFSSSYSSSASTPFDTQILTSRQPTDDTFDIQICGGESVLCGGTNGVVGGLHGDIGDGTGNWLTTGVNYQYSFGSATWQYVTLGFTTTSWTMYLNGAEVANGGYSGTPSLLDSNSYLIVGNGFLGDIANIQIYNASLSANEIQALYLEGIGGAPIKLQNLVGWWPLNGNANDYSGNNNNGVPSGVTYTNQWTSGYTTP